MWEYVLVRFSFAGTGGALQRRIRLPLCLLLLLHPWWLVCEQMFLRATKKTAKNVSQFPVPVGRDGPGSTAEEAAAGCTQGQMSGQTQPVLSVSGQSSESTPLVGPTRAPLDSVK